MAFVETINGYGGVVHELRGDALLAEISRATDAVSARPVMLDIGRIGAFSRNESLTLKIWMDSPMAKTYPIGRCIALHR